MVTRILITLLRCNRKKDIRWIKNFKTNINHILRDKTAILTHLKIHKNIAVTINKLLKMNNRIMTYYLNIYHILLIKSIKPSNGKLDSIAVRKILQFRSYKCTSLS